MEKFDFSSRKPSKENTAKKPSSKRKRPATEAWMTQWRLFRDMVATF